MKKRLIALALMLSLLFSCALAEDARYGQVYDTAQDAGRLTVRTTGPLVSNASAASYRLWKVSRPTTPSTVSPARVCHALTARVVAAPNFPSTVTVGTSL